MTQEIDLGGTIYISSRRGAEITGYAQDYIGQLARAGHIEARRVAGLWYVLEESLRIHKEKADQFVPTPPQKIESPEMETSVSFDGRDYISAARAARVTGYSQDYVGQLARSEKILSRLVGNRWYVDRAGIVEHKRHNDSLLAAVQAESVGISTPLQQVSAPVSDEEPHYSYLTDASELYPTLAVEEDGIDITDTSQSETPHVTEETKTLSEESPESENHIPIRVLRPIAEKKVAKATKSTYPRQLASKTSRIAIFLLVFLVVGVGSFFAIMRFGLPGFWGGNRIDARVNMLPSANEPQNTEISGRIVRFTTAVFSKELNYSR